MISQGAGGKTLVALTAPAIWTGSSGGNATLKFLVTSQNCNQPCGRGGWLNVCHRSLTSLIPPLLWETAHLSRESFSRLGRAAGVQQEARSRGAWYKSDSLPPRGTWGESFSSLASVSDTQKRYKDRTKSSYSPDNRRAAANTIANT